MSGGRGRGRGGYKPPTGAQLMLQRSAQESGLDERNLKTLQDLTKPILFPDHLWHSSEGQTRGAVAAAEPVTSSDAAGMTNNMPIVQPKRTQSEIYKIRKAREFQHHMHTSPFYLRPSLEVDVARHVAKRARPDGSIGAQIISKSCDKVVVEHLGKMANSRFIPEELLLNKARKSAAVASGGGVNAAGVLLDDDLEVKAEGEEGEDGDDVYVEPEEEDDGEDYGKDHYASDSDGGDGDGDGEPTF